MDRAAADRSLVRAGLREPLPLAVTVGGGACLPILGWAFHPAARVRAVTVECRVAGEPTIVARPDLQGLIAGDVLAAHFPHADPRGLSFHSGYRALLDLPARAADARAEVVARIALADGTVAARVLGGFLLRAAVPAAPPLHFDPPGPGPLVAVCMATYNPPPKLFRVQLESLKAQTHRRWVCLIRDDGSTPDALARIHATVGDDPRFVVRRNESNLGFYANFGACLADVPREAEFVAMADQDDRWEPTKLEALLAACSPDTELAFSDMRIVGADGTVQSPTYWTHRDVNSDHFGDLLIANTVTGAASLFRRHLLDDLLPFPPKVPEAYHDHWVALVARARGHVAYVDRPLYDYVQHGGNVIGHCAPRPGRWLGVPVRFAAFFLPHRLRRNVRTWLYQGSIYAADVSRVQHMAAHLKLRLGDRLPADRAAIVDRALAMTKPGGWRWLLSRPWWSSKHWRRTIGYEWHLTHGLLWRLTQRVRAAVGPRVAQRGWLAAWLARRAAKFGPPPTRPVPADRLADKLAPLTLIVDRHAPPRVNVLLAAPDEAAAELGRRLTDRGIAVRFLPGNCPEPLTVSPADAFVATDWTTAHVAHAAARSLGDRPFVSLVHDDWAALATPGTHAAMAAEALRFPQCAVVSSESLRRHLGLRTAVAFQPPVTPQPRDPSATKRLAVWCGGPLFDLALLAVRKAVARGAFAGWTVHGLGHPDGAGEIALGDDAVMHLLPPKAWPAVRALLPTYSVGLALHGTAHPGPVPLAMMAAGVQTVTADGTVDDLAAKLLDAELCADTSSPPLAWAATWDEAFPPAVVDRVEAFVRAALGDEVPVRRAA